MEITIDHILSHKVPHFKVGIIHYNQIEVGPSPQMVKGRLQLFQESLFFELEEKEFTDFPGISEWQQISKTTGTNPSRYRSSVEVLYSRIKKQNYLQPVHSAIDLNTFFSLQYGVPIGIYDTDKLKGNISITIREFCDENKEKNGRNTLDNMILSADDIGPFGSPYVDSERTKVTELTKNAIQIIYLQPSIHPDSARKLTESLMNMFLQVHGGEANYTILT